MVDGGQTVIDGPVPIKVGPSYQLIVTGTFGPVGVKRQASLNADQLPVFLPGGVYPIVPAAF